MSKHLRWTKEQLVEFLARRHGAEAAAIHPTLQAVERKKRDSQEARVQTAVGSAVGQDKTQPANKASVGAGSAESRPGRPLLHNDPKAVVATQRLTKKRLKTCALDDEKKEAPRLNQRARAIASLEMATWEVSHRPGEHMEIRLFGVILLSVNLLYGLMHYERVKYRKAWHRLIEKITEDALGQKEERVAFSHFIIRAHKVSRRKADTDAKNGFLKYPIDGLRYSGVITEDTETHFRDLLCSQSVGKPALVLRIEAVAADYVPLAHRGDWLNSLTGPENIIQPKQPKARKRRVPVGATE